MRAEFQTLKARESNFNIFNYTLDKVLYLIKTLFNVERMSQSYLIFCYFERHY